MKPERAPTPDESSATSNDTAADATSVSEKKTSAGDAAADPAEKIPGATTELKPERVQKPD